MTNADLDAIFKSRNEKIKEYIDNKSSAFKVYRLIPSRQLDKDAVANYSLTDIFNPNLSQATGWHAGDLIYDRRGSFGIIYSDYDPDIDNCTVETISYEFTGTVEGVKLGVDGDPIYPNDGIVPIPLADINTLENPKLGELVTGDSLTDIHIGLVELFNHYLIPNLENIQFDFSFLDIHSLWDTLIMIDFYNPDGTPDSLTITLSLLWYNDPGDTVIFDVLSYSNGVLTFAESDGNNNGLKYDYRFRVITFTSPSNQFYNYWSHENNTEELNEIMRNFPLIGTISYSDKGVITPESDTILINDGRLEVPMVSDNDRVNPTLMELINGDNLVSMSLYMQSILNVMNQIGEYPQYPWMLKILTSNLSIQFYVGQGEQEINLMNEQTGQNYPLYADSSGIWYGFDVNNDYFTWYAPSKTLLIKNSVFNGVQTGNFPVDKLNEFESKIVFNGYLEGDSTTGLVKPKSDTLTIWDGTLEVKTLGCNFGDFNMINDLDANNKISITDFHINLAGDTPVIPYVKIKDMNITNPIAPGTNYEVIIFLQDLTGWTVDPAEILAQPIEGDLIFDARPDPSKPHTDVNQFRVSYQLWNIEGNKAHFQFTFVDGLGLGDFSQARFRVNSCSYMPIRS